MASQILVGYLWGEEIDTAKAQGKHQGLDTTELQGDAKQGSTGSQSKYTMPGR